MRREVQWEGPRHPCNCDYRETFHVRMCVCVWERDRAYVCVRELVYQRVCMCCHIRDVQDIYVPTDTSILTCRKCTVRDSEFVTTFLFEPDNHVEDIPVPNHTRINIYIWWTNGSWLVLFDNIHIRTSTRCRRYTCSEPHTHPHLPLIDV